MLLRSASFFAGADQTGWAGRARPSNRLSTRRRRRSRRPGLGPTRPRVTSPGNTSARFQPAAGSIRKLPLNFVKADVSPVRWSRVLRDARASSMIRLWMQFALSFRLSDSALIIHCLASVCGIHVGTLTRAYFSANRLSGRSTTAMITLP